MVEDGAPHGRSRLATAKIIQQPLHAKVLRVRFNLGQPQQTIRREESPANALPIFIRSAGGNRSHPLCATTV